MSINLLFPLLIISDFSPISNVLDGHLHPLKFTEFCQPDATMPFGKELMQITKDLRIALPTITGKATSSYPEDSRYRIEVHVPGRTFESRTEPVDFKFIAPNWILGRYMAIHCALGRIKEVYRGCLFHRTYSRYLGEEKMEKSSQARPRTLSCPMHRPWRSTAGLWSITRSRTPGRSSNCHSASLSLKMQPGKPTMSMSWR